MGSIVAKHNSKIMKKSATQQAKPVAECNCKPSFKADCPMPGKCNQDGVVYQTTISSDGGKVNNYVGLAKNFKKRWGKHKSTLGDSEADGQTTMSKYYWKEKNAGRDPKLSWKYLEKNIPTFNPITAKCRLCLREKFNIVLKPELASLNKRTEVFAHCRHIRFKLITIPPDKRK